MIQFDVDPLRDTRHDTVEPRDRLDFAALHRDRHSPEQQYQHQRPDGQEQDHGADSSSTSSFSSSSCASSTFSFPSSSSANGDDGAVVLLGWHEVMIDEDAADELNDERDQKGRQQRHQ